MPTGRMNDISTKSRTALEHSLMALARDLNIGSRPLYFSGVSDPILANQRYLHHLS
jgi:hypothetical protein